MKKITMLITIFFLSTLLSFAKNQKKNFGNAVVSEIISIYDADTFKINIKDWPDIIGNHISIRVNGIDAPEIRGKCKKEKEQARQAKQITVEFLSSSDIVELRNMRRGKYFRILADVYGDGKSLGEHLKESGLVREYTGGSRMNWCN